MFYISYKNICFTLVIRTYVLRPVIRTYVLCRGKKISLSAYFLMISIIVRLIFPVTILLITTSIAVMITMAIAMLTSVVVIGVVITSAMISVMSAIILSAMIIIVICLSSLSLFYVYIIAQSGPFVNPFLIIYFVFLCTKIVNKLLTNHTGANICSFYV